MAQRLQVVRDGRALAPATECAPTRALEESLAASARWRVLQLVGLLAAAARPVRRWFAVRLINR